MRFTTLADWLSWQETLHPKKIDPGLERSGEVLRRMGLKPQAYTVITVGGTNGKGSSVAMLEAVLLAAGYRVGAYSSPHLLRYNERIRVNGIEATDDELCAAFARIDEARGGISLSYFEFGTLAAFDIFHRAELDVAILEVGMGGRLDVVNLFDADAALVTTIGLDHMEWLGPDRESIAAEKARIFRPGRPAIYGEADPPQSLVAHAKEIAAPLYCFKRDFDYKTQGQDWSWWGPGRVIEALPIPGLQGGFQLQNAAAVLMTLETLATHRDVLVSREAGHRERPAQLSVSGHDIKQGLSTVNLPGRFQVSTGTDMVTRIFDVAHNPHAAAALARTLREQPCAGRTLAVFSMLADKDIASVVREMRDVVDAWYAASLSVERGSSAERVAQHVRDVIPEAEVYSSHETVEQAYHAALLAAGAQDRIVVFGSFYTVAEALRQDYNK
ncbi:MAG: bifunctional tetrahydrofolate synthase/dihydrofolate synthase [Gammaproteobacteria bacterium]|nr:bifunctional tetrahydrofolate synthase/dihydrofolate synthase [Gammaproteobacteria bacterium]